MVILLTGVSVSIAAVYYTINIRHQRAARQIQLFMNIYSRFDNQQLMRSLIDSRYNEWNTFEEWMEKYGPQGDREAYTNWVSLQNALQGIGHLVSEGYVRPETVSGLMGAIPTLNWERNEPIIRGLREKLGSSTLWDDVESLYHEMAKIRISKH